MIRSVLSCGAAAVLALIVFAGGLIPGDPEGTPPNAAADSEREAAEFEHSGEARQPNGELSHEVIRR